MLYRLINLLGLLLSMGIGSLFTLFCVGILQMSFDGRWVIVQLVSSGSVAYLLGIIRDKVIHLIHM